MIHTLENLTGSFTFSGIDRVDGHKGYSIENCVPCCKKCNLKKNKVSIDIMIKSLEFLGYTINANNREN